MYTCDKKGSMKSHLSFLAPIDGQEPLDCFNNRNSLTRKCPDLKMQSAVVKGYKVLFFYDEDYFTVRQD